MVADKTAQKKDSKILDKENEGDKRLKDELEQYIECIKSASTEKYEECLINIKRHIQSETGSMTSAPKPFKYLCKYIDDLISLYDNWDSLSNKKILAEIISVLSIGKSNNKNILRYHKLGSFGCINEWGYEYVRHLSESIRQEYLERCDSSDISTENKVIPDDLLELVKVIIPYDLSHNGEIDACDLAMELEQCRILESHLDLRNYKRVSMYLSSCVNYVSEPENIDLLNCVYRIYTNFYCLPDALLIAIRINDNELIKNVFKMASQPNSIDKKSKIDEKNVLNTREDCCVMLRQLCYILAVIGFSFDIETIELDKLDYTSEFVESLQETLFNSKLSQNYINFGQELDILEPKVPEDVYKSHLDNHSLLSGALGVDTAKQNLASTFVNAFINAGFCTDKMLLDEGNKWIYKNREIGMMSATASLGLLLMWNVDDGLSVIDKYLSSADDYIKAGALLACGIVSNRVKNIFDPSMAILNDHIQCQSIQVKIAVAMGLGISYAGTNKQEVLTLLYGMINDSKLSMEIIGIAALSIGMVSIGSMNGEAASSILQAAMERSDSKLKDVHARNIALGLGLIYFGKQEIAEPSIAALNVLPAHFAKMACLIMEICAYAGTGNVLKVQSMFQSCHDKPTTDKSNTSSKTEEGPKSSETQNIETSSVTANANSSNNQGKPTTETQSTNSYQSLAVLGISLIAMAEDIGVKMARHSLSHLLQFGDPVVRRTVPLAIALLSPSDPQIMVCETLSKLSHDHDQEVALNAIFAMGIIGAGTNNNKIALLLRQLAHYYHKDQANLFVIRIAQGLVHAGKGTLTLNQYHFEGSVLSPVAVASLLVTSMCFLESKQTILGRNHYMLYWLSVALRPRILVTFDIDGRQLNVPVRVGQAVDVIGQAGHPKTITGFQTHNTPVILGTGERAELASDEYVALSPILEGFVILRKVEQNICV